MLEAGLASDIKKMENVCRLAAEVLNQVEKIIRPGLNLLEIDEFVSDYTKSRGAISAPLNYGGFPKSCCISPNQVICHGVPNDSILKSGDIVNVDVTPFLDGFHGDSSATFLVGEVSLENKKLVQVAHDAMMVGIEAVTPWGTVGDIGYAVQHFVSKAGFFAVKELGGHGIGRKFHDEPFVPSFGKKSRGFRLQRWKCITVEPMINFSNAPIREIEIPGSSVCVYETSDGLYSAQFEHTVLVTDKGFEILTLR